MYFFFLSYLPTYLNWILLHVVFACAWRAARTESRDHYWSSFSWSVSFQRLPVRLWLSDDLVSRTLQLRTVRSIGTTGHVQPCQLWNRCSLFQSYWTEAEKTGSSKSRIDIGEHPAVGFNEVRWFLGYYYALWLKLSFKTFSTCSCGWPVLSLIVLSCHRLRKSVYSLYRALKIPKSKCLRY